MNAIHDGILVANDKLTWLLIVLLAAAGILFTLWSKGAQFRRFGTMVKVAIGSRSGGGEGICWRCCFARGMMQPISEMNSSR